MQPIVLPFRNPAAQLNQFIWQLALSKIGHQADMEMLDKRLEQKKLEIEAARNQLGENRVLKYQEEGRTEVEPIEMQRFTGSSRPPGGVHEPITGTSWSKKPPTERGLQRKTRVWWEGNSQYAQDYNFDPASGMETPTGKQRVVYSWKGGEANLQRKKRVFIGEGGKSMAQDYNFNPKTGTETPIGLPYEVPKSTSLFDLLDQPGQPQTPSIEPFTGKDMYTIPGTKRKVPIRTIDEYNKYILGK